ncbi:phenazine biosynthesis protein PhzF family [Georgenia satyanarayanai]|uniref:Phenazine biosynthesis protein PhzF family n=1 Tax=Georgenia satyanarayanai TaxID=860221 RepID=A0A2Y9ASP4_9MICO|nr:PhzF family phenazine biosynthesis protein [Georgenia satyanarayanai]PYF97242.1 PhzF family phenazine biosynthesis protein [Georgenia satyanarayanai]SSA46328.1 phenazine biosynthesis protein PhzF family [Georgenia satyanarayanai]
MLQRRFLQVDVFGAEPYEGNPVAVVVDGEGLSTERMQRVAAWTNLSETTFLLPPTDPAADYRVRIFTPGTELPFAGHPTLGSAHAWLAAGSTPAAEGRLVQECGVGLVELRESGGRWSFAAPALRRYEAPDDATLARAVDALGLEPADVVDASWLDNGPPWLGLRLRSREAVLAVRPRFADLGDLHLGVVATPGSEGTAVEVRAFGTDFSEDPVTGSLNAGLAQWLTDTGVVSAPYVAAQGTALGRAGRVHVTEADGRLWVGGRTTTAIAGTVAL